MAAAGAALARQQDVSKLAEQLGEVQAAREREVAALQVCGGGLSRLLRGCTGGWRGGIP